MRVVSYKQPIRNKNNSTKSQDADMTFFDPSLIKAARNIYRNYYSVGFPNEDRALGVIINRDNHRGQLAFKKKPVLLPRECFIPIGQIESEAY